MSIGPTRSKMSVIGNIANAPQRRLDVAQQQAIGRHWQLHADRPAYFDQFHLIGIARRQQRSTRSPRVGHVARLGVRDCRRMGAMISSIARLSGCASAIGAALS